MSIRCALGIHDNETIDKKNGTIFDKKKTWNATAVLFLYRCRRCGRKTARGFASTTTVTINPEWFEGQLKAEQEDGAKVDGITKWVTDEQAGLN